MSQPRFFQPGSHAFLQNAVIHDDLDAGGFGLSGGFVMDNAFLEPEARDFEADDVLNDSGDVFGGAEDVDQVDFRVSGEGGVQVGIRFFAEDAVDGRIDGDDAVALGLHEAGDTEGSATLAVGEAHDGDSVGAVEDLANGCLFVHSCSMREINN